LATGKGLSRKEKKDVSRNPVAFPPRPYGMLRFIKNAREGEWSR
jgi:hypothetical protein